MTVYVDGQHGTTGLKIIEYLEKTPELTLLTVNYHERHDLKIRKHLLNTCDIAVLCLPDEASKETIKLIENPNTCVIDTSTAHRTDEGWDYGLPELGQVHLRQLTQSKRIANPGCHASAAILLLKPLIDECLIDSESVYTLTSITGYSGGGKKMIEDYEHHVIRAPRHYSLDLCHKHIPEIMAYTGLKVKPIFMPIIGGHSNGIALTLALSKSQLNRQVNFKKLYDSFYKDSLSYLGTDYPQGIWDTDACDFADGFKISIWGNDDQIVLGIKLDNLGKGASGAVMQMIHLLIQNHKDKTTEVRV